MKNFTKLLGIIALIAVIGFSMAACGDSDDSGTTTTNNGGGGTTNSLNGVWRNSSGSLQITVSGSAGVFSYFGTLNALSQSAKDKNYIKINDQYWKGLTSTGNLTWSGQVLQINSATTSPNVATGTSWTNATFNLSTDGQTLTVTNSETHNSVTSTVTSTWTRSAPSLDGVWGNSSGSLQITVSGSAGVFSYFGTLNALSQSAKDKNYIKINDQYWKGLTSTGNLTWSGQVLQINSATTSPNVATGTSWTNATFNLSTDGQTLTVTNSETHNSVTSTVTSTWTKN